MDNMKPLIPSMNVVPSSRRFMRKQIVDKRIIALESCIKTYEDGIKKTKQQLEDTGLQNTGVQAALFSLTQNETLCKLMQEIVETLKFMRVEED
jgi:hypothetical protein